MSNIFFLLSLLTLVLGLLFLIWPEGFKMLTKLNWGRGKIFLTTFVLFFAWLIAIGITAPPLPAEQADEATIEEIVTEIEEEPVIESSDVTSGTPAVETIELKYIHENSELTTQPDSSASTTAAEQTSDPSESPSVSEPEPQPEPDPKSTPTSTYICSSNYYNCTNLTHAEGQAIYEYCWQQVGSDIHRLDGDDDGLACEK